MESSIIFVMEGTGLYLFICVLWIGVVNNVGNILWVHCRIISALEGPWFKFTSMVHNKFYCKGRTFNIWCCFWFLHKEKYFITLDMIVLFANKNFVNRRNTGKNWRTYWGKKEERTIIIIQYMLINSQPWVLECSFICRHHK